MIYRVVWGLGRYEDFATQQEAASRSDEIHAELVETWPMLSGTNDAVLPRVVEMPSDEEAQNLDGTNYWKQHDDPRAMGRGVGYQDTRGS